MKAAIRKRLQKLEAVVDRVDLKPVMLLEVDALDPADRDAFFDGDDSVLTRYGFEPSPSQISAIVISVHPDRLDDSADIADIDDEEFERIERQRELEDRRRKRNEAERAQLDAIRASQAAYPQPPPVPGNAYSHADDWD